MDAEFDKGKSITGSRISKDGVDKIGLYDNLKLLQQQRKQR